MLPPLRPLNETMGLAASRPAQKHEALERVVGLVVNGGFANGPSNPQQCSDGDPQGLGYD